MFYLMFNYLQHSFAQSRLILSWLVDRSFHAYSNRVDQAHTAELDRSRLSRVVGSSMLDVNKP